jgi:DNA processing protein
MIADRALTDDERLDWIQLSQTDNVGPVTFKNLLTRYGSAKAAMAALPELSKKGGKPVATKLFPRSQAEAHVARAKEFGAIFVAPGEKGYPSLLRNIYGAPALLCVSGRLELAEQNAVAIVGARNASALGLKFTRMVAHKLMEADIVVVSGLARGIDTAAHETSLAKGTAAVVAGGIDHFYPPENEKLQRAIAKDNLLITEMMPGTAPKAEHFPRRNRLISGMSRAVVVIEAAMRSGSLITARYALEQGREVFAVPGSPLDPRNEGCNKLIKDGANIISRIEDILEVLSLSSMGSAEVFLDSSDVTPDGETDYTETDRKRVITLMSHTATDIDDIARESNLPVSAVLAIILELEVAGKALRSSGNRVVLL